MISVLFAFNFGVEPFDLPQDLLFLLCFYIHHYAVVLECTLLSAYNLHNSVNNVSLGISHGVLFGHAWMMHPIGYFATKNFIDKQSLFFPYIISGFICMIIYWRSCFNTVDVIPFWILQIPLTLQYIGRWGLWLRLCALFGFHKIDNPNYDEFEWKKQYYEAGFLLLSFVIVKLQQQ